MGFRPCISKEDPFTQRVRGTYRANVVSAPRAGIDPLDTLAVRKRRVEPRGRLTGMIDAGLDLPATDEASAIAMTGVRSTEVNLELGLSLTAKFLAALGVPVPGAEISATLWDGATGFSFEVQDVVERQVDVALLGRALQGRHVERTPATEVFFDPEGAELYVITRTLTSSRLAIRGTGRQGQSATVSVDAIKNLIGDASAGVTWRTEGTDTVSFSGSEPVTFAFAALPCALDAAGGVVLGLATHDLTFGAAAPAELEPKPLVDEAGLIELEEPAVSG